MKKNLGWVLITVGFALTGCGRGGSTYQPKPPAKVDANQAKEGADQNFVPFQEGNQWTYTAKLTQVVGKRQQTSAPIEQTFKIVKVERTPTGVRATFDVTINGKLSDHQVWLANDKGIYQVSIGLVPKDFSTPQPIILFPADTNKTFKWQGTGPLPNGQSGLNTVDSKILGPQEVDTDAGRVKAIAIYSKTSFATPKGAAGNATSTIWLAPGIGIARYTQDAVSGTSAARLLLELKSHSLKK